MVGKSLVEVRSISKKFHLDSGSDLPVLENMNLAVYEDEVLALLGPSGCGKSTLLRIMSGLIPATQGQVLWQGSELKGVNTGAAMVFQNYALFPWETIFTNIALALNPNDWTRKEIQEKTKRVIDMVGLEGFEEAYPRELSGGMKQRAGIARALVMERPLLFLDEPFSSMDILTADMLRQEMLDIFLEKRTSLRSMLLVTHNIQEAVLMANRILVMASNPGYVRAEIINDLPYPRNEDSPAYQQMVKQIHHLITDTLMPDLQPIGIGSELRPTQKTIEILPNVQITAVIGLLEIISDQGGSADIFELAHQMGKDFGLTLYTVKAAEILNLVDTPRQMVRLTEEGRQFVIGDINFRKKKLHQLFEQLRIVQMCTELLKNSENVSLPLELMIEKMQEWLPNEKPQQMVEVLISWGRFAEYFGYNDDTKEIYLDVGQETA